MNPFKLINISLGSIMVGSSSTIYFPYDASIIDSILGMSAPCTCTNLTNDIKNSRISVEYKAGDIPIHLNSTSQYIKMMITVSYKTKDNPIEQQIILSFNATKKR